MAFNEELLRAEVCREFENARSLQTAEEHFESSGLRIDTSRAVAATYRETKRSKDQLLWAAIKADPERLAERNAKRRAAAKLRRMQ